MFFSLSLSDVTSQLDSGDASWSEILILGSCYKLPSAHDFQYWLNIPILLMWTLIIPSQADFHISLLPFPVSLNWNIYSHPTLMTPDIRPPHHENVVFEPQPTVPLMVLELNFRKAKGKRKARQGRDGESNLL